MVFSLDSPRVSSPKLGLETRYIGDTIVSSSFRKFFIFNDLA